MYSIKRFFFFVFLIIGLIAFVAANVIFNGTPSNLSELKVVTGPIKHTVHFAGTVSSGNPLRGTYRSAVAPYINLTVVGSDILFKLNYAQNRLNEIENAPKGSIAKVTYHVNGFESNVWGFELNGVVIEKPEDHLEIYKSLYKKIYFAAGLFIAIAVLLATLAKSKPKNRSEQNN